MSYADRAPALSGRILAGFGKVLGLIVLVLLVLLIALSVPARSAEYLVFSAEAKTSTAAQDAALADMNRKVGCELWGKPVEKEGLPALRFRFPAISPDSDADFVQCIRQAMPSGHKLEKASWLTSKLHERRS